MKKRYSLVFLTILLSFLSGVWLGSSRERSRCAILILDETLTDISMTRWFLKDLEEKGVEGAEKKMKEYISSSFDHLDAVLESSSGFGDYKVSWKDSRYPQNLLFDLDAEINSLRQAVEDSR